MKSVCSLLFCYVATCICRSGNHDGFTQCLWCLQLSMGNVGKACFYVVRVLYSVCKV